HIWRWNKFIELYIYEEAFSKLLSHCFAYGERNLEVMGFLIGDVYKWKENEYTVVRDVVTTELDTTEVSVRFKQDAFDRLFEAMDKLAYDYLLVGWYHSHPGHRCYLSSTDIETQTRMFKSTFQTAVVMDPHNFELKAYKVKKDEKKLNSREKVVEISYAVFGIGPPKVL
ncbi:MAG: Mov34/MPN/PAD-1 family protein, partial [Thermoplasmata archaeon]